MTVPIELSNVTAPRIFTPLSRYINGTVDVILYGEDRIPTITTYKRANYVPSGNEKSMLITKGLEYRPDLVAFDIYGVVDVWWKILEANKMSDVFDFKAGKTIILPNDVF